jgi:hypothetical protein
MKFRTKIQTPLLIFIFFAFIYSLTAKGFIEIGDTYYSVRTAESLIERGSLAIKKPAVHLGYPGQVEELPKAGPYYSKIGLGLALLYIPVVEIAKLISSIAHQDYGRIVGFLVSFVNVPFGAGSCVLFYYLCRKLSGSEKTGILSALLLGLTTVTWHYSVSDFSEASQMFFLLLAVTGLFAGSTANLAVSGLAFSFLLLLRLVNAIYLPAIALYVILSKRASGVPQLLSSMSAFFVPVILALSAIGGLNYVRFGGVFETGYRAEIQYSSLGNIPSHLPHLLFSLEKGFLIYSPILLAAIFGFPIFFRRYPQECLLSVAIVLLNLLYSSWWWGYGDWCWGPRFLVLTTPLWLLPICFLLNRSRLHNLVIGGLAVLSLALQFLSVIVSVHEWKTLREVVPPQIASQLPSDIPGAVLLLIHKLHSPENMYRFTELGISSPGMISSQYHEGFNLWFLHATRHFSNAKMVLVIPAVLIPLGLITWMLLRRLAQKDAQVGTDG